jgi:hypothetical protein
MVAKPFEDTVWGFLYENAKKEKRMKLSDAKVFYIRICRQETLTLFLGSFGSICKNLTY